MQQHSRAIYGATQSTFGAPADCRFTQRGNRLYLHIFSWPFRHIHLPGFAGKVAYAQLLHDGSEIKLLEPGKHNQWSIAEVSNDTLTLDLPVIKPAVIVPVIELFLK
jgi:alpha-L-fucosidase